MKTDAINRQIAEPYATALMALAEEQNCVDAIANDVQGITTVINSASELMRFLASPVMPDPVKRQVWRTVFPDLHPITQNFINLLIDRGRIPFLRDIAIAFQALVRAKKNIALAEVTSATTLTPDQIESLKQKVMALTGAQAVELEITNDPSLIGGVVIKIGSQIIDASLRGQLRRISSRLFASV